MNLKMHFRTAITNLNSTKLRSMLAALGILVGTASVVAMISGGQLASYQALQQFKALGTNLMSITINTASSSDSGDSSNLSSATTSSPVTVQEAINLKTASSDITSIAPYISLYQPMKFQGHTVSGTILGTTETLQNIMKLTMQEGRFVSLLDKNNYYCVIGQKIYTELKKYSLDPMGQQISIGSSIFTIIGILKDWTQNSFIYADLNQSVFVPINTAYIISSYAQIYNVILKLNEGTNITTLEQDITNYFNQNIPGKSLYFQSAAQILASMTSQQQILTAFLGFIGGISLLVGGIGIMNIMLVSVAERRQEIGIRLAVGAKKRDIQKMFLIEAIVLSFFGGIAGVLLGLTISFAIAIYQGWLFMIFYQPILLGFVVSVLTGIFFGFYPAYKASKLLPIETLRGIE